jgi:hypothetical protein
MHDASTHYAKPISGPAVILISFIWLVSLKSELTLQTQKKIKFGRNRQNRPPISAKIGRVSPKSAEIENNFRSLHSSQQTLARKYIARSRIGT